MSLICPSVRIECDGIRWCRSSCKQTSNDGEGDPGFSTNVGIPDRRIRRQTTQQTGYIRTYFKLMDGASQDEWRRRDPKQLISPITSHWISLPTISVDCIFYLCATWLDTSIILEFRFLATRPSTNQVRASRSHRIGSLVWIQILYWYRVMEKERKRNIMVVIEFQWFTGHRIVT